MKLIDALKIAASGPGDGAPATRIALICSFTPLHLETFLKAHLQLRRPDTHIELSTGQFGDLQGNLQRAKSTKADGAALVVEWSDLDLRLGLRESGSWSPSNHADMVESASFRLRLLEEELAQLAESCPVAIALPTLPFPPASHTSNIEISDFELSLRSRLADFAVNCASIAQIRVLNSQQLHHVSPLASRLDLRSELNNGHPYQTDHCDHLANLLTQLLFPAAPKKGIITDLDDTLWSGILGEVGVDGISWGMDDHSGVHALYQRLLAALSESGVFVGVASKNDSELVETAIGRDDLLIPRDELCPIEAHWNPKSTSVQRILDRWNVGSDSVVFVDDSPMELAEVNGVYPDIECLQFTKDDPNAVNNLLCRLRDLFGKSQLQKEDRLRVASMRSAARLHEASEAGTESHEDFLSKSQPVLNIHFQPRQDDSRAIELINKTNQFNLNGIRRSEAEWQRSLGSRDAFVMSASYEDKFGPLGTITVMTGEILSDRLKVITWVMSCRAFARRIEHQMLRVAFDHFAVSEIEFAYEPTSRNLPLRDFLISFNETLEEDGGPLRLEKGDFDASSPALYHTVNLIASEENPSCQ